MNEFIANYFTSSEIQSSFDQQMDDTDVDNDVLKSIIDRIITILSINDLEDKDQIINDLLINGRQSLVKYKDVIPETYNKAIEGNDNELMRLLKKYFQQKLEIQYGTSNQWFVSFLKQHQNEESYGVYDRVLTRTAEYGNKYMKDSPILSIVLQIVFESIDDECLKNKNTFNDLWFTITNNGLKSITEFSSYITKRLLNEQLQHQSILYRALREYYRKDVFLSLARCNIVNKNNLYDLILNTVTEHGWLADMESVREEIPSTSYEALLKIFKSFYSSLKFQKQQGNLDIALCVKTNRYTVVHNIKIMSLII